MKMIRFKWQLEPLIKDKDEFKERIAVEALIFTNEGKLVQIKRGPKCIDEIGKYEGVGGSIGPHTDLHEVLQERISRELGANVRVKIDELLEIRFVKFKEKGGNLRGWTVVSYLCKLVEGKLPEKPIEEGMAESIEEFSLSDLFKLDKSKFSPSTVRAREVYERKYGNRPYYEIR